MTPRQKRNAALISEFYKAHGPCCAGCDWWRFYNSLAGECIRTIPVVGIQRFSMLGLTGISLDVGAGHISTLRDHVCGEFKDEL